MKNIIKKIKTLFYKINSFIIINLLKIAGLKTYPVISYGLIFHIVCGKFENDIVFKRIEEIDKIEKYNGYYRGLIQSKEAERLKEIEEKLGV